LAANRPNNLFLGYLLLYEALQPEPGLGRLIVEVSRRTSRHTHPLGLLWTNDQPVAEAATCTAHNKHKRLTPIPSVGF